MGLKVHFNWTCGRSKIEYLPQQSFQLRVKIDDLGIVASFFNVKNAKLL